MISIRAFLLLHKMREIWDISRNFKSYHLWRVYFTLQFFEPIQSFITKTALLWVKVYSYEITLMKKLLLRSFLLARITRKLRKFASNRFENPQRLSCWAQRFSKQQKQDCCSKKALHVTFKIWYFYAFMELVAARLVEHGTTDRMDPGL